MLREESKVFNNRILEIRWVQKRKKKIKFKSSCPCEIHWEDKTSIPKITFYKYILLIIGEFRGK